jgi:hypothetical protein
MLSHTDRYDFWKNPSIMRPRRELNKISKSIESR